MTQRGGYTFRKLRADDAAEVSACARRVHGDDYPRQDVYHPDRIIGFNEAGTWVSMVALDEHERLVGHMALEPSRFGRVAEMIMGMVLPEHRRHGVLEGLRDAVVAWGLEAGLAGEFVELDVKSVAAQNLANRSPTRPCALTLGMWPDPSGPDAPRSSYIRYFRYLERPREVRLHLPARHHGIVARIYQELGVAVVFGGDGAPSGRAELDVVEHPDWGTALATVVEIGAGTHDDISALERRFMADARLAAVYLELPMSAPGAVDACAHAESLGFFFGGVSPFGARQGDALRLQRHKEGVRLGELGFAHPFARELLDHMADTRDRRA